MLLILRPLAAGCLAKGDPAEVEAAGATPAPAGAVPVTTPVSWSATLGTSACVPAGPGFCVIPVGGGDVSTKLAYEGRATRVALQVAWTPTTPLTETLEAVLVQAASCGDGCTKGAILERARGPSPLAFDVEAPEMAEAEFLLLAVRFASPTSGTPVYGFAGTDQPVEATGEVVSLVAAEP